jgi:protein-S-isoprenylcysteine O-methyltransferase Ste14
METRMKTKKKTKILPPTIFWLLVMASAGTSLSTRFIYPEERIAASLPYSENFWIIAGSLLITAGIALNIWTDLIFKREATTVKPHEEPSKLITAGPFRVSRHPMYLGMTMILFGLPLILSGPSTTFMFPIAFIMAMEMLFIPFEEANCEKIFKNSYIDYKKGVRRWI